MSQIKNKRQVTKGVNREKILLAALPFWTPLIPSQGIASLKGFLQRYGHQVRAVDLAASSELLESYKKYFDTLKKFIPPENRGNFYNIGHDVLRNHMMAHTNYTNETDYIKLVKMLIYQTYFYEANQAQLLELIQVVDQYFDRLQEIFLKLLEEENPSVLGLSVNSGNFPSSNFIFRLTRNHYPHIQTVMGGCIFFNHLAMGNPDLEYFLEKSKSYIDAFIIGKGEILFLKLLRGEWPGCQRVFSQKDIGEEELKLYSIDIPDLSDYHLDQYLYLAASGSSGCPYKCSFCNSATFFGAFKEKEAARTVEEMIRLHQRHGHRLFFMTDALLNQVIGDISRRFIQSDVSLYMDGYFIVDKQTADMENTLLWRRGGFYRARLGVESGSQRVLDLIGKRITSEMIKAAVSCLAIAGIKTTTYWVIGHPGETEADFQQTLRILEELRNDIWQAECNPFTYFYVGQSHNNEWANIRRLLYPENARDMLISQTWVLACQPSRKETYNRVCRFVERCEQLGIPNPYSVDELYKADERWKKLHKNAVPSIIDLSNNNVDMKESKKVKKFLKVQHKNEHDQGDFAFQM
jgi:hypothetical protein